MGCHLFNRHKLGSAAGANLINRAPLPAESYGPLTTSRSLQGLIVEARHASRRLQPVLLHGLDPRHEFAHNVIGNTPKLPTGSLREDDTSDHDRRVYPRGLLVN